MTALFHSNRCSAQQTLIALFGGQVFNYSNTQGKVVVDPSVEAFHNKFKRRYGGKDIALFYGVAP